MILAFLAESVVLAQISSVAFGEGVIDDFGYAVAVDSAGNIIMTGATESSGAGLDDVFIAKYSSTKVQLWSVTWGGGSSDQGYSVSVDLTDDIVVTGQTYSFGAGDADVFVAKYSSSGVQLWNTTWGGSNSECGYDVTVDSANNIIITGYTNSFGAGLDDVFIAKYSSSGVLLWNHTWGSSYNDQSQGIAVDSMDNIVVTGYTDISGTSVYNALIVKFSSSGVDQWNLTIGEGNDFGNGIAVDSADNIIITGYKFSSSTSSWDAFIVKCHPSGVKLWSRTLGGNGDEHGYGIAVDSTNEIVITGETNSSGAGLDDAFIAKYSTFGVKLWNTTWGGAGNDSGHGVTADPADDTIVVGFTNSFGASGYDAFVLHVSTAPLWYDSWGGLTVDESRDVAMDSEDNILLAGYTDSFGAGGIDAFVAKYSSLGVQEWNFTWGGSGIEYGSAVAVDSTDNVVVTGSTRSFGAGGYDAFVAKYSSSGIQQWNLTWGESNHDYGYGVAVDSEDNIVVIGSTEFFGADNEDAFIVKYSSSGLQLWNATWGGFGSEYGYDVAIDSVDNIIVAGHTYSFVEGISDAFIVKYSSSGALQWNRKWGGSYNDYGYAVAIDSADNIIITGETYRSTSDGIDVFVVKYSSLGVELWNRVWGGSGSDYGYGVAVDSTNTIVVTGTTESLGVGLRDAFTLKYPSSGFQSWYILWEGLSETTHDITIASLSVSKTIVGQGYTVKINVNVTNQGEVAETFNVTAYANTTVIEEQTVTLLAPRENLTLTFTWNTTGIATDNYTISAYAPPVLGETYTVDNTYVDGIDTVTIPGDIDGDGDVDLDDLYYILIAYGTTIGDPDYNSNTDINGDGEINLDDLYYVLWNYGT